MVHYNENENDNEKWIISSYKTKIDLGVDIDKNMLNPKGVQ